jgi:hypothetical protein
MVGKNLIENNGKAAAGDALVLCDMEINERDSLCKDKSAGKRKISFSLFLYNAIVSRKTIHSFLCDSLFHKNCLF